MASINRGDRLEHYETVRLRKDGRAIQVSLTMSPIRDQRGQIIGVSHIARDISERKRAEDLLRESEAELRAVLESASQGVLAIDGTGRIELVNGKVEELFGYRREELLGQSLETLLPDRPGWRTTSITCSQRSWVTRAWRWRPCGRPAPTAS